MTGRQTGEVRLSPDQALERVERFGDELRDLRQRWDNRLVLERENWAEAYLDGRLEILIYGEWAAGSEKMLWVGRITPETYVPVDVAGKDQRNFDGDEGDRGDKQIVLVVIVEVVEAPERLVRSVLRPYLIKDEFLSSGKGLLYFLQNGRGYKVFPHWVDGKVLFGTGFDGADNSGAKVIQRRSKVVHCIANDERERFRDWLCGPINEAEGSGLIRGPGPHVRLHAKHVEIVREGVRQADKLINVAVGPLNL